MRRFLIAIVGTFYAAFAAFMLIDSASWLSVMIGRDVQGPLPGQHFIFDVALAFLASAFGFILAAVRPENSDTARVACLYPALHAGMHVLAVTHGEAPRWLFDFVVIVAPALLGVVLAFPRRTTAP